MLNLVLGEFISIWYNIDAIKLSYGYMMNITLDKS